MESLAENSGMNKPFKQIFKILHELEKGLDVADFDPSEALTPALLKMTRARFNAYLEMLAEAGYIKGIEIRENIDGLQDFDISGAHITLSGLQYLAENAMMVRAYKVFREARGFLPH